MGTEWIFIRKLTNHPPLSICVCSLLIELEARHAPTPPFFCGKGGIKIPLVHAEKSLERRDKISSIETQACKGRLIA